MSLRYFETMPDLATKHKRQINKDMSSDEIHEEAVFIALQRYKELSSELNVLKKEVNDNR
jgi:hypothetical protein